MYCIIFMKGFLIMAIPDPNQKEAVSFRIKQQIKNNLEVLSKSTGRSQTFLVEEALQQYIDLNTWQINAIKEGIEAAENDESYSTEEILARLEKSGEK
jgi:RHH-type transcriptional regulator, rel operon repressor / antitoxin RelB